MIKRKQQFEVTEQFQKDVKQLNLVKNQNNIYYYSGRIQVIFPIYIQKAGNVAQKSEIEDTVNENNHYRLLWLQTLSHKAI